MTAEEVQVGDREGHDGKLSSGKEWLGGRNLATLHLHTPASLAFHITKKKKGWWWGVVCPTTAPPPTCQIPAIALQNPLSLPFPFPLGDYDPGALYLSASPRVSNCLVPPRNDQMPFLYLHAYHHHSIVEFRTIK